MKWNETICEENMGKYSVDNDSWEDEMMRIEPEPGRHMGSYADTGIIMFGHL
jgi:hypothetical protein